jgi:2',3'-cyclic-nucleotide 2'-phosphodiesterase (5'-nucleotidase family)
LQRFRSVALLFQYPRSSGIELALNLTGPTGQALRSSSISAHFTVVNPYGGPNGDNTQDERINWDGTDAGGRKVPVTVLNYNDSWGNLNRGSYVGSTQLAAALKQERLHNPNRSLLLNVGDSFQRDATMCYFRTAARGYVADGTPLPMEMPINPLMKAVNYMNCDAMTLGNHEFNFGKEVFTGAPARAEFPVLHKPNSER